MTNPTYYVMTNDKADNNNIKFSDKEIQFLLNNEVYRVATVSPDNIPHVVPVSYIFIDNLQQITIRGNIKISKRIRMWHL